ncbi:AEC family transporter [Roseovarius amoyensis]|uniref:AEC family transporter n=1 Tax=Roseovarius amoyensis TaxID=2211448 RepID=UPI0013A70C20|nr:AEC family transporter [Roseovarius amoyensis]
MSLALSVLPIILTVAVGYIVVNSGVLPRDRWDGINALNFNILIPATLIHAIATADLSHLASGDWVIALLATLGILAGVTITLRFLINPTVLPNPSFSTLFQTTTRWNAFIGLAAADQLIGGNGIALLALGMAILIPVINVANIVILVIFGTAQTSATKVARSIMQNPLVIGCAVGLLINMVEIQLPVPVMSALDLISRAALGIGLLAVGAGVALSRLFERSWKVWIGVFLRVGLAPAVFVVLAVGFQLSSGETLAGTLIFAVPAAANGYIVAQRMGGDADLYADILTWQIFLSLAMLPVWAALVHLVR